MSIQFLRGTRTKIKSSEVVPKAGQPLYATDTHKLYVGDGTTPAKNLKGIVGVDDAFEIDTSTGELVIKLNTADTLIVQEASYNTNIDGVIDSWGHVKTTSYDQLFNAISDTSTVLISDESIDANLGNNMNMVTEQEQPSDWVSTIINKTGSVDSVVMPSSLAIKLYNSGHADLVSHNTYGLLRDQALGLETDVIMPTTKVFNDASSIVNNDDGNLIIIFSVNWPENLQYDSVENNAIALDCANAVIGLINYDVNYKVILSIHCTDNNLYQDVAGGMINYICNQTSAEGMLADTENVFNEIVSNNRLFVLNPYTSELGFAQALPSRLPNSAFIFYDDSTNDFNTAVLKNLSAFNEKGYNIYITNRLYNCYNLIQTAGSPFSLVINDKTQFMKMYQSSEQVQTNIFSRFDKIVLGAELALSMLRKYSRASSFSQYVLDQLLDENTCSNFLTVYNSSVSYAMNVEYVKDKQIITTINKITVKQSETY